VTTMMSINSFF